MDGNTPYTSIFARQRETIIQRTYAPPIAEYTRTVVVSQATLYGCRVGKVRRPRSRLRRVWDVLQGR